MSDRDFSNGEPQPVNRILKWLRPAWLRPYGEDDPADRITGSELLQAMAEWDERLRLGLGNRDELARLHKLLGYGSED